MRSRRSREAERKDALVAIVHKERKIPQECRPLAPEQEQESEESVCAVFREDELRGAAATKRG